MDYAKVWIEADWVRVGVLAALAALALFLARRRSSARPGEADPRA